MKTKGIAVYGGSSNSVNRVYLEAAYQIGQEIAKRGWRLVNGSGDTGMMGAATRGAQSGGGETIGIAPYFFNTPGILYNKGEDTIFTRTMRERKAFMESLSSAFITTPGGVGTLEEFYEILTLKQLEQLDAPLILLNLGGYYDSLLKAMEDMKEAGFIHESVFSLFTVTDSVEETFKVLEEAFASKN